MRSPRGRPPDPISLQPHANTQGATATDMRRTAPAHIGRLRLIAPGAVLPTGGLEPTERDHRLLAQATRYPGIVPSQAWRWEWSASPKIKPAWNRLAELARAGLLVRIPLRRGESVFLATEAGAKLVRELTGGLSAPRVPDATDGRWLGQLRHDLTLPEVERWLLERARRKGHAGARFLTGRQLARARAMALPPHLRRGGAVLGYMPDGTSHSTSA